MTRTVSASASAGRRSIASHAAATRVSGQPDRVTYDLLPVSETHFLMPPADPLEDPQTVASYDFVDGKAQYLHTNCRVLVRST